MNWPLKLQKKSYLCVLAFTSMLKYKTGYVFHKCMKSQVETIVIIFIMGSKERAAVFRGEPSTWWTLLFGHRGGNVGHLEVQFLEWSEASLFIADVCLGITTNNRKEMGWTNPLTLYHKSRKKWKPNRPLCFPCPWGLCLFSGLGLFLLSPLEGSSIKHLCVN